MQAPLLAYTHFVEVLFVLNNCRPGISQMRVSPEGVFSDVPAMLAEAPMHTSGAGGLDGTILLGTLCASASSCRCSHLACPGTLHGVKPHPCMPQNANSQLADHADSMLGGRKHGGALPTRVIISFRHSLCLHLRAASTSLGCTTSANFRHGQALVPAAGEEAATAQHSAALTRCCPAGSDARARHRRSTIFTCASQP